MRVEHSSGVEDFHRNSAQLPSCCGCGSRPPAFHPKVVTQSVAEFRWMLGDLLTQRQTTMKTVILPKGLSMEDPRLKRAAVVSRKSYVLAPGELPILPIMPFVTDVEGVLIPPCEGPQSGKLTRMQILPESLIADSENLAEDLVKLGNLNPEQTTNQVPPFLIEFEKFRDGTKQSGLPLPELFPPAMVIPKGEKDEMIPESHISNISTRLPSSHSSSFSYH